MMTQAKRKRGSLQEDEKSIPFGDQATTSFSMFQAWQGKAKWQSERHFCTLQRMQHGHAQLAPCKEAALYFFSFFLSSRLVRRRRYLARAHFALKSAAAAAAFSASPSREEPRRPGRLSTIIIACHHVKIIYSGPRKTYNKDGTPLGKQQQQQLLCGIVYNRSPQRINSNTPAHVPSLR